MAATAGIAAGLAGLPDIDADAEIQRLNSIVESGIEPRIPSPDLRAVSLSNGRPALIMAIRRSWLRPHRVGFQDWSRFYSRNSAGKFLLSVPELRDIFIRSETLAERVRQFRGERLNLIATDETPTPVSDDPKLVVHLVPFAAFDPGTRVDVTRLANYRIGLNPLGEYSWSSQYNFDGFLTRYAPPQSGRARSYAQVFRNGCIEAVQADQVWEREGQRHFGATHLQDTLLASLPRYIGVQQDLGCAPPLAILLSLLGMKGCVMTAAGALSRYPHYRNAYPIDRDALLLPEVLVDRYDSDLPAALRPAFDALWNAAGWPRCMHYNESGEWQPLK